MWLIARQTCNIRSHIEAALGVAVEQRQKRLQHRAAESTLSVMVDGRERFTV